MLGSISAGPIYTAFPISKMLLSKGASVANIVIILSAWAVIKVPMLARAIEKIVDPKALDGRSDQLLSNATPPQIELITAYCTGCGICTRIFPEGYAISGRKAQVKIATVDAKNLPLVVATTEKCPVHAIVLHGTLHLPQYSIYNFSTVYSPVFGGYFFFNCFCILNDCICPCEVYCIYKQTKL